MSDTLPKPEEQYRAGSWVVGAETPMQERSERAKRGLSIDDDPMREVDDLLDFESAHGRRFETPDEVLAVAVRYWIHGADDGGRVLPDEGQSSPLLIGLTVEHQVALFAETTPGFERAKLAVWLGYRYYPSSTTENESDALRLYMDELRARLPHTFYPPRPELSGLELDRMEAAAEAARMREIDRKHMRRSPGMARIFRGFNESWNENR